MSPADEWGKDRLDDLASQVRMVASVTTLVATHDAKIDAIIDDVRSIERMRDANVTRFEKRLDELAVEQRKAVKEWSRACSEQVARLEAKIDAQVLAQQANRWTPTQWAAVLGPTFAALIAAVALIVTGGGA